MGDLQFRPNATNLDFSILLNKDVGFVGMDEYGLLSRQNEAEGLRPSPVDRLDIDWLASTFDAEPLQSAAQPLEPQDLHLTRWGVFHH